MFTSYVSVTSEYPVFVLHESETRFGDTFLSSLPTPRAVMGASCVILMYFFSSFL